MKKSGMKKGIIDVMYHQMRKAEVYMETKDVFLEDALTFTKRIANAYFVDRDMNALTSVMASNVSWIGSGRNECGHNLTEAKIAFAQHVMEYDGAFAIHDTTFHCIPCDTITCVVYGFLHAIPSNITICEELLRISLVIRKQLESFEIVHMHLSHADQVQEQGQYYTKAENRKKNEELQQELHIRRHQLEQLTKFIPGGVHQCLNDEHLTLVSMSDGFLSMFGYTQTEIKEQFHNHYVEMIDERDREAMIHQLQEQLEQGPEIELEYRVICKNGRSVWILDQGRLLDDEDGNACFYCMQMEISDRIQEQEELRLSLERHQVIMDQTTDIIFEWDIHKDTLIFSSNWRKKFGYEPIESNISERIPFSDNIFPNDMPEFVKIMQDTAAGVPYSEAEFRIKDHKSRFIWCRIRATTQYNSDHHPIKAIGVITDVDYDKKEKEALLNLAQHDSLTGLYNKITVQNRIELLMDAYPEETYQAMFVIDVDRFKYVNDTYGHLTGDHVLNDVACMLRKKVRSSDLIGRVGGDEFIVYFANLPSPSAAYQKSEELQASLCEIQPMSNVEPITCSIGVAVFHHGDVSFQELYEYADQALYFRKDNGRNGVMIYDESCCDYSISKMERQSKEIDQLNETMDDMAQYAFRSLYAAKDIDSALHRLLEIIARAYDVNRAYIFESNEAGTHCSNTFEWCKEGTPPEIDHLQHLSYLEDLDDYQSNFDESGMFYCADVRDMPKNLKSVLEPQGIRSMLQCAMLDEGAFVGYVGFDECRTYRAWTPQQIAAFKLTADVLSTFLVKLRQKQKLKKK